MCRVVCKLTRVAHKLSQIQNSKKKIEILMLLSKKKVHNLKVLNDNNNNISLKFTDNFIYLSC